ncbi:TIGR03087 family PEP-CTERM/XrtA system glycosyltransferase [Aquabacterium sp. OR-4]|uniref:TIGR03087 family PEP-CTERM/XrtA system glycosyltransferase n=1 Tax=Aquabacterium sp. OR-4 TaxID=2978127 RepID=UPI0021B301A5|nr:TIGR03087 family PEP-CTERM/XrtA system glycosyltransferase [Aquabacterium sp. OR-4]MDT7837670.1 TIGR03087 family PEP-CTERM/XrtA system glycosyltransferase [Aquabacterium sp. OR-4]
MAKLLYLVHRLPYPPNKGDKVRSYHLLRHLLEQGHQVHLGTFVDDPDDAQHLPALRALCASLCAVPLAPRGARLRSLGGLATGQALTLRYYADAGLHRWVRETVAREGIDAVVVFSSAMAPYAVHAPGRPLLLDLVDVDSAKWTEYAANHAWPMSWIYRREGERLLAYERMAVQGATQSFLVTDKEVALFERLAPDCAGRVAAVGNGVDAQSFAPLAERASPFTADELPLVFTGAMDYWPNVDAVSWFVQAMLPALRQRWPALRLHIVGRAPSPAVQALAGAAVQVTGTVPDVRPYLQHARAVVAPLRLARGVQNKVLEAMAMARPVVCAAACAEAIAAADGQHLAAATTPDDYVRQIDTLLRDAPAAEALGQRARHFVLDHYSWAARLAPLDRILERALATARSAPTPAFA